jgi:mycothiol system anti-sigma-R factor
MTCRDAIAVIGELLDGLLTPEVVARLEEHLADCAPCRAYLATYRATRGLVQQEGRVEMPVELRERLRRSLRDQLAS